MEVRAARASELDEVGRLTVAAYAEFTTGPADSYVAKLADAATRAAQAHLLVAVDDGVVLGTVTSCPSGSSWRELAAPHEGEFRMLAVDPRARGRGVGVALVDACEDRARGAGATAMVISSLPQMRAAHRLYAARGYARTPARDWSPVPGVALLAFCRDL